MKARIAISAMTRSRTLIVRFIIAPMRSPITKGITTGINQAISGGTDIVMNHFFVFLYFPCAKVRCLRFDEFFR